MIAQFIFVEIELIMILKIQNLTEYGIFRNYKNASNTNEFKSKNIIYGWNGSGKSTISNLFRTLETKEVSDGFLNSKFILRLI
jgi:wobble nucleotide-excising tRNase